MTANYESMDLKQLKEELASINTQTNKIKSAMKENEKVDDEKKQEAKVNVRFEYERQLSDLQEKRDRVNQYMKKLMVGN